MDQVGALDTITHVPAAPPCHASIGRHTAVHLGRPGMNAAGDIGYLAREGKPISDDGIQHVLKSLDFWAKQRILNDA